MNHFAKFVNVEALNLRQYSLRIIAKSILRHNHLLVAALTFVAVAVVGENAVVSGKMLCPMNPFAETLIQLSTVMQNFAVAVVAGENVAVNGKINFQLKSLAKFVAVNN